MAGKWRSRTTALQGKVLTWKGCCWGRLGRGLSCQPLSDCACLMSSLKAWLSLAAALELAAALPVLLLGSCFEGILGRNTCANHKKAHRAPSRIPCQKVQKTPLDIHACLPV